VADPAHVVSAPIDIVIADDHAMVRAGLRLLLEADPGLHVVAEASDVDAALVHTRTHRPAVVLLDLNMPGSRTLPAIPRFFEASPGVAVVVLTMDEDPAFAREAIRAGATGYVLKEAAEGELVEAVRVAAEGGAYVNPRIGQRLASTAGEPPAPTTPEDALEVGAAFAGHRIDELAGRGGMAVVYRATDLALDRPVALKLIAPGVARDPVFRARFERECRLAAALDHPHVVAVFRAGEERGWLYLSMRYVDGTDLRSLLLREGLLDPRRAVAIVDQIAGGLDEAHRHGLVHRDVKPANVLIGGRRDQEHAFLTDFGVTIDPTAATHLTATGFAVGTADYMAPEQARGGDVDRRADVYALGCVLFRVLTGTVVYERTSQLDTLWAHVHEPPPALRDIAPDLPSQLGDVLARALAKDPDDRQQSASALARDALVALDPER
jgi:DNA-binding NarL/FixJ family response regulator